MNLIIEDGKIIGDQNGMTLDFGSGKVIDRSDSEALVCSFVDQELRDGVVPSIRWTERALYDSGNNPVLKWDAPNPIFQGDLGVNGNIVSDLKFSSKDSHLFVYDEENGQRYKLVVRNGVLGIESA